MLAPARRPGCCLSAREPLPRVRAFAADPAELRQARGFVRERASADRVPQALAEELAVAVTEAFSNAVAHSESLLILVSWQAGYREVEVQVVDDGVFHDRLPLEREGGLGMSLMMSMVDEMTIQRGTYESPGTLVRLRKKVGQEVGPTHLFLLPGIEGAEEGRSA